MDIRKETLLKIDYHFDTFKKNPLLITECLKSVLYISDIPFMSIENVAQHADYVTKQMHKEESIYWDCFCRDGIANVGRIIIYDDKMNGGAYANIAYVALNCNKELKDTAVKQYNKLVRLLKENLYSWNIHLVSKET